MACLGRFPIASWSARSRSEGQGAECDRDGCGPERWTHDSEMLEQRRVVLAKARDQLLGAQPKKKKLRRPPMRYVTDLQPGDVLSFRASNGRFALARVTRLDLGRNSIAPIVKVLRYADRAEPNSEEIAALPDRQSPKSTLRRVRRRHGGRSIGGWRAMPESPMSRLDSVA